MHLVFPPLFPSGLLKSKIPPTNFEVCKRVGVFLFFPFIVSRDFCTCSGCRADVSGDTLLCFTCVSDFDFIRYAVHPGLVQLCYACSSSSNLPHLLFLSSGDERRTKTDKLTRACNLLVKAK